MVLSMGNPKLNETKANKEPLGKIFWFLWLPWFVLLLLLALISMYQKEGIIHQDDLGNTVFSRVETFSLFFLVGGPFWFWFLTYLISALFDKINKAPFSGFNYVVVLPLTVLICGSMGIFTPYWTSLKFDNEAKVLIKTDYSLSKPNQKMIMPYNEIRFDYSRRYRSADSGNNYYMVYYIYLEIPKKAPKPITTPSDAWHEKRWQIYSSSWFRFWSREKHWDETYRLFRKLTDTRNTSSD